MDKGAQEKVDPRLEEYTKLSREISESKDIRLMTLAQMIALAMWKIYEDVGQWQLSLGEDIRSTLEVVGNIETRLTQLEKMPHAENVELENLRRKLRAQENKLKKHAPMLEFLEEWVDAQRNRYIGEHR